MKIMGINVKNNVGVSYLQSENIGCGLAYNYIEKYIDDILENNICG